MRNGPPCCCGRTPNPSRSRWRTAASRTFAPELGDPFDPRMHRRVGGQPPEDPALAGRIASVSRDGYLDVDSNSPLAPAEVVVFGTLAATAAPAARTDQRSES